MCGQFTRNYTRQQIRALYRLTAPAGGISNFQPRYNVCPTDPVVVAGEARRMKGSDDIDRARLLSRLQCASAG